VGADGRTGVNDWSRLEDFAYAEFHHCRAHADLRRAFMRWSRLRRRGLTSDEADMCAGLAFARRRSAAARRALNTIQIACFGGLSLYEAVWAAPDD